LVFRLGNITENIFGNLIFRFRNITGRITEAIGICIVILYDIMPYSQGETNCNNS